MYLNASTDKIEIVLGGTVATNQLQWNVSYQDITSSGMTLPQSGGAGLTNNATAVDIVAAPAASTTRQVTQINVYNADTATATVTIQKDVSGTNYVLIRYALTTLDTLMWSREDGWRVMSATGGGTTYTFSTGLTNTSGTVTANLSTGVAGGQSVVGGTAASNNLTLSSTSNATKGKILFGTSAYDEVNNRLGIGTQSPETGIHNITTATSVAGTDAPENLNIDRYAGSVGGAAATCVLRKARGTFSSPSAVQSGDTLGVFGFRGHNGTAMTTASRAAIIAYASENWTSTANGTYFSFLTTADGTSTQNERLRIFQSGNVFIGASPTDAGFRLDVNGTARFQGNVTISTKDIITDTTTGSKIATGNTQKLGFWNATPIAQPTTAVAAATRVGGGGTTLTDTDTFDGYTLAQVVKALRNAGLLQ